MNSVENNKCTTVFKFHKVEVARIHSARMKLFVDDFKRTFYGVCHRCYHILNMVWSHYLHPHNILFCFVVIQYMRSVHFTFRMKRTCLIIRLRKTNDAFIFPVVQIIRRVQPDSPMPNSVVVKGLFFILSVPVKFAVSINHTSAMCLYSFSVCIKPWLTRLN